MINENMIYPFAYSEKNLILPDVTVIPNYDKNVTSNFNIVKSYNVLFPEAANDLEAAKEFKEVLSKIQIYSEKPGYVCSLDSVNRFGVQKGAEEIVELILTKYVDVCREKRKAKLGFEPGIQYNFSKLGNEGIEVSLGNYGTFAATLLKAAENKEYKKELIKKGQEVLGNRQGFFVNPPAINAICETKDKYILIVNRGPTAEYNKMYHAIAAGHHDDKRKWGKVGDIIPLEDLITYQINMGVGLSKKNLKEFKFNGIAFSAGNDKDISGTEKVELLAYAKIDKTLKEVVKSLRNAPHKWETRQLLAVPREKINDFIKRTSDTRKEVGYVAGIKKHFSDVQPGTDPNSKTYWVPVGLANLIAWTKTNPYILD